MELLVSQKTGQTPSSSEVIDLLNYEKLFEDLMGGFFANHFGKIPVQLGHSYTFLTITYFDI